MAAVLDPHHGQIRRIGVETVVVTLEPSPDYATSQPTAIVTIVMLSLIGVTNEWTPAMDTLSQVLVATARCRPGSAARVRSRRQSTSWMSTTHRTPMRASAS